VRSMKFCPKCGSLMVVKVINNASVFYCPRCGYKVDVIKNSVFLKKSVSFEKRVEKREEIAVDIPLGAIFVESIVCPKCGRSGVYYWRKQVSSAESSDTIAKTYKCSSCGYTWSELE
jgi:DNA-directed RNA polymerase subunit M